MRLLLKHLQAFEVTSLELSSTAVKTTTASFLRDSTGGFHLNLGNQEGITLLKLGFPSNAQLIR